MFSIHIANPVNTYANTTSILEVPSHNVVCLVLDGCSIGISSIRNHHS